MKRCTCCNMDKMPDEFGRNRSRRDGLQSHCKECRNREARIDRMLNPGTSESKREYDRRYYRRNRERIIRRRLERHYEDKRQAQAHNRIQAAIASRQLQPPTECECAECGNPAQEYHHENYAQPLDVTPLCRGCHRRLHYAMRNQTASMERVSDDGKRIGAD